MTTLTTLTTTEAFDAAIAENQTLWVFKHSAICPTSSMAFQEFQTYLAGDNDIPAVVVVVQDARPVSNHIATVLGRVHQSPQAFLVQDGAVIWDASHWSITARALRTAREQLD